MRTQVASPLRSVRLDRLLGIEFFFHLLPTEPEVCDDGVERGAVSIVGQGTGEHQGRSLMSSSIARMRVSLVAPITIAAG